MLKVDPGMGARTCVFGTKTKDAKKRRVVNREDIFTAGMGEAAMLVVRGELVKELPEEVVLRARFLILDETQLVTAGVMKSLLRFRGVRAVVGCSGTPEKPDQRHEGMLKFLGGVEVVARHERPGNVVFADVRVVADETKYMEALRTRDDKGALVEYGRLERGIACSAAANNRIALLALAVARAGKKVLVITKYVEQTWRVVETLRAWGVGRGVHGGLRGGERRGGAPEVRRLRGGAGGDER
jgi:superfamily II DNA or RNA helicase